MSPKRLLPRPALSVALVLAWMAANNDADAGTLLSGAALAVVIPLLAARFYEPGARAARLRPLARLAGRVAVDIVLANVRVAWLILGPTRRLAPRFFEVPLDLRSPRAITLLASIISLTPGTVTANVSGDRRRLLVHGLAVRDVPATVAEIKRRYESPVKEAFEC